MATTMLRVLRATVVLGIVAIGMAMHSAHRRAEANMARVTEICRAYLDRRDRAPDATHPLIRRLDRNCGLTEDPMLADGAGAPPAAAVSPRSGW